MISQLKVPPVSDSNKKYKIEDLLNRKPISLGTENIQRQIYNRRILITGASGSIGSELAKQIAAFHPSELILIDKCEGTLTALEIELSSRFWNLNLNVQMADITDEIRIRHIFEKTRPHLVYHAAALKHVPFVEKQPYDAIKTNILGTKILIDISAEMEVEKFIFVSTDKAVNPSSLMGASKRFGEIMMARQNKHLGGSTEFITARFGNVLGTSGSVVNVFEQQIREGGPLTLTHKNMKRYFMTTFEAGRLLLEAGAMGKDGEILIFRMGNPEYIYDLALKLIAFHGLKPFEDIDIEYTGIRPGEKLTEELINANDVLHPTHHPDIIIASLGSSSFVDTPKFLDEIRIGLLSPDPSILTQLIKAAVPEYHPPSEIMVTE